MQRTLEIEERLTLARNRGGKSGLGPLQAATVACNIHETSLTYNLTRASTVGGHWTVVAAKHRRRHRAHDSNECRSAHEVSNRALPRLPGYCFSSAVEQDRSAKRRPQSSSSARIFASDSQSTRTVLPQLVQLDTDERQPAMLHDSTTALAARDDQRRASLALTIMPRPLSSSHRVTRLNTSPPPPPLSSSRSAHRVYIDQRRADPAN